MGINTDESSILPTEVSYLEQPIIVTQEFPETWVEADISAIVISQQNDGKMADRFQVPSDQLSFADQAKMAMSATESQRSAAADIRFRRFVFGLVQAFEDPDGLYSQMTQVISKQQRSAIARRIEQNSQHSTDSSGGYSSQGSQAEDGVLAWGIPIRITNEWVPYLILSEIDDSGRVALLYANAADGYQGGIYFNRIKTKSLSIASGAVLGNEIDLTGVNGVFYSSSLVLAESQDYFEVLYGDRSRKCPKSDCLQWVPSEIAAIGPASNTFVFSDRRVVSLKGSLSDAGQSLDAMRFTLDAPSSGGTSNVTAGMIDTTYYQCTLSQERDSLVACYAVDSMAPRVPSVFYSTDGGVNWQSSPTIGGLAQYWRGKVVVAHGRISLLMPVMQSGWNKPRYEVRSFVPGVSNAWELELELGQLEPTQDVQILENSINFRIAADSGVLCTLDVSTDSSVWMRHKDDGLWAPKQTLSGPDGAQASALVLSDQLTGACLWQDSQMDIHAQMIHNGQPRSTPTQIVDAAASIHYGRSGQFGSLGDGQVHFRATMSRNGQYGLVCYNRSDGAWCLPLRKI